MKTAEQMQHVVQEAIMAPLPPDDVFLSNFDRLELARGGEVSSPTE